MPICPKCSLGIPPTVSECPDCGRRVVEIERAEEIEDPFVEPAILSGPTQAPADSITFDVEELLELEPPEVEEPFAVQEEEDEREDVVEVAEILVHLEADESEDPDEDLEEVVVAQEEEETEPEGEDPEEFLAGTKRFTRRIDPGPVRQPSSEPSAPRAKPVRWAHRAYRGDVGVISVSSRAVVTVAVFGDGLLLIESAGSIGGLVPVLTGWRSPRKAFSQAGSSAEAEARVQGSRRLATPEIQGVRITKGRARVRDLTIRTTDGEELHYRIASKRCRLLTSLLAPILGAKLRDASTGEKAPRRAG